MAIFRGWGGAAIVTGASSGIGLELARALAARDMPLILTARSADNLKSLANDLTNRFGVKALAVPLDLSDPEGPKRLADELASVELDIDLLVNNAGFGTYGRFGRLGPEKEAEMVRLNASAPVDLAARFLPGMIRRGRGIILNVASTAAFAPVPWLASYSASKAFLLSWSEALDAELSDTGVRSLCLCPGTTATPFRDIAGATERQARKMAQQTTTEVVEECLRGLDRGKRVIVTGRLNRIHTTLASALPRRLTTHLAHDVMRPKPGAE